LLDTRRYAQLDGFGELVTSLVLQILSWLAEEERKKIKERQREGIDAAMRRGIRFGRPPVPKPKNFHEVYIKWKNGEITATKAMQLLGLKRNTFYKFAREQEEENKQTIYKESLGAIIPRIFLFKISLKKILDIKKYLSIKCLKTKKKR